MLLHALDGAKKDEVTTLVRQFSAQLRNNPRRAWQFVSAVSKQPAKAFPADTPEERLNAFHAHFSKLFATDSTPPDLTKPPPDAVRTSQTPDRDTGPFTTAELHQAVRNAKNNRSPGSDEVPNEILKLPELQKYL
eukprot:PhM_4_TR3375/c2_g1_i7/m.90662